MAFKDIDIADHLPSGYASTLNAGKLFAARGVVGVDGLEEAKENIILMMERMVQQSVGASSKLAHKLLDMAKHHVPYKTGDLFGTGKVTSAQPVGGRGAGGKFIKGTITEFIVSFGGGSVDYALLIHENPDGKTFVQNPEGCPPEYRGSVKMSHYLSYPAEMIAKEIRPTVADAVQGAVMEAIARAKRSARTSMQPRLVKK